MPPTSPEDTLEGEAGRVEGWGAAICGLSSGREEEEACVAVVLSLAPGCQAPACRPASIKARQLAVG